MVFFPLFMREKKTTDHARQPKGCTVTVAQSPSKHASADCRTTHINAAFHTALGMISYKT
ncbi:MAG: hypothetical protein KBT09_06165 [Bacteroidales bacterium]|nr:hypothetical protein [Candidatus Sodaliphilus fimicaballi]